MMQDLIKLLNNGNGKEERLTPLERKEILKRYKPFYDVEIPTDILTNVHSGSILDIIISSKEIGFDYNINNKDLLGFLYKKLIHNEQELDGTGITSSIKNNFFIPIIKADFDTKSALKEIYKLVDEYWGHKQAQSIAYNITKQMTTLLLLRYVRKYGLDDELRNLGVQEMQVNSKNKFIDKFKIDKENMERRNFIAKIDNSFIENEINTINELKSIKCEKWPGIMHPTRIKGCIPQSKEILDTLKIKLRLKSGTETCPLDISYLDNVAENDVVIISSYGILDPYIKELNENNIYSGSIILRIRELVDTIISHIHSMHLFNNRIDLSKAKYEHLMIKLEREYRTLNTTWFKSIRRKTLCNVEEIIESVEESSIRYKKICNYINRVFNYKFIIDEDPFKKEYIS